MAAAGAGLVTRKQCPQRGPRAAGPRVPAASAPTGADASRLNSRVRLRRPRLADTSRRSGRHPPRHPGVPPERRHLAPCPRPDRHWPGRLLSLPVVPAHPGNPGGPAHVRGPLARLIGLLANLLDLRLLSWIFRTTAPAILVGIIVLFQPE